VARSSRLSTCEIEVRDRAGTLVALFHGTAYVKKETLAELAKGPARRATRSKKEKRHAKSPSHNT
jgi:hypothetical protein